MSDCRLLRHRRATALLKVASAMILDGCEEPETLDALRFAVLTLKRPSGYLRIFCGADLTIDPGNVDRFIRFYSAWIPGESYASPHEVDLLHTHNTAAKEYQCSPDVRALPASYDGTTIALTRQPDGNYAR